MPTFEFQCPSCKALDELIILSLKDETITLTCESCDVPMVRKFSPPAIQFSGDGWAKKDRKAGK